MSGSRSQNAKRNSIWGMLQKIVAIFGPFFVRTILIKILGAEYLGLGSLFTSILSVLSLAELGFGAAIVFSMYKPIAENQKDVICALLNIYRKIYRVVGAIVLILGLSLLPVLPQLIKSGVPADINIYILFIIYLVNSVSSYWLFAYKISLINAHQRADVTSKIDFILMIGLYTAESVSLIIFRNYYCYAVLLPCYTIARNFVASHYVKKMFPEYLPSGKISKEMESSLKKSVLGLMITKLSSVSRNAFDSIIISALIGLTAVAIYNNYYYVLNAITGLLLVFTTAIAAPIGNSVASETKEKNFEDMNRLNFAYMWISGWCTVCLACLYQPFMNIWVGKGLMFSDAVMWLFPIYFIIIKLGDIQGQYFDAAGLWWYRKWYSILEALGNLALNLVLGYLWGIVGVLIATILTVFIFNFLLTSRVIFKYFFGSGYWKYISSQLAYMLVSLVAAGISYCVCRYCTANINDNWLVLAINTMVCIVVPNLFFLLCYSKTNIFTNTVKWLIPRLLCR